MLKLLSIDIYLIPKQSHYQSDGTVGRTMQEVEELLRAERQRDFFGSYKPIHPGFKVGFYWLLDCWPKILAQMIIG